jgi:hypothetical protein
VTDATEATDRGIVLQLRRGAPARDRREDLPVAEMVVVGVAVFTITALAFFRVAILPSIGADLAMSTAQLGLFSATYAVGRVLTDLPAGQLADRIPVVSVMRRAAWIVALGSGLLAIAPVSAVAFAGMFVLGVGTALANTSGATYFSTVAPCHVADSPSPASPASSWAARRSGRRSPVPWPPSARGGRRGWRQFSSPSPRRRDVPGSGHHRARCPRPPQP